MSPFEQSVVDGQVRELKARGAWVIKTHGTLARRGLPDLLACWHGRFVAVESKQPGKSATKLQWAVLDRIRRAGGVAVVCSSRAELAAVLDSLEPLNVHNLGGIR